jgi:hypothetical protein
MNSVTLDEVIDSAMQLPEEQREMLISILTMRQIEARRHEIARDAQESLAAFKMGKLKAQTPEEAIRELEQSIEDDINSLCNAHYFPQDAHILYDSK